MSAPIVVPSPASLGYIDPTDTQIAQAIADVIADEYNGQSVTIVRNSVGNLGTALRHVLKTSRVVIPEQARLERILNAYGFAQVWCARPTSMGMLVELYAPDKPATEEAL